MKTKWITAIILTLALHLQAAEPQTYPPKALFGSIKGGACAVLEEASGPVLVVKHREQDAATAEKVKRLSSIGYSGWSGSGFGKTEPVLEMELEVESMRQVVVEIPSFEYGEFIRLAVYSEFEELLYEKIIERAALFDALENGGGSLVFEPGVSFDKSSTVYIRLEMMGCSFRMGSLRLEP